ncbi:MAG: hypothetical protein M3N17_00395, partial [Actinomycetota bacterium]|nr:hypothetical protein [Actinomycetota bacterium]
MTVPGRGGTADVVVPSVGRPSLGSLLRALAGQPAFTGRVLVVDDRARVDGDVLAGRAPADLG